MMQRFTHNWLSFEGNGHYVITDGFARQDSSVRRRNHEWRVEAKKHGSPMDTALYAAYLAYTNFSENVTVVGDEGNVRVSPVVGHYRGDGYERLLFNYRHAHTITNAFNRIRHPLSLYPDEHLIIGASAIMLYSLTQEAYTSCRRGFSSRRYSSRLM